MKQEYTAIKIWDNLFGCYIKSGNKQEWQKVSYAKNAAIHYLKEKNKKLASKPIYHLGFDNQTRMEIHEVRVTFTKITKL